MQNNRKELIIEILATDMGIASAVTFNILKADSELQINHDQTFMEILEVIQSFVAGFETVRGKLTEVLATNFQLSPKLLEAVSVAGLDSRKEGIYLDSSSMDKIRNAQLWQTLEERSRVKELIFKKKKI